jgi:tRNA-specific 2-thiouridylase
MSATKRAIVAMSGGVDSTVAAALLKRDGYEVLGLTMMTHDLNDPLNCKYKGKSCCGFDAMEDAMHAAETLGIPHHFIDAREQFSEHVIKNFTAEYLSGHTPNPCIICNRDIKWGLMLQKAEELGGDIFATGHYARSMFDAEKKRHILLRGVYVEKDQSYVLWPLTQDALKKTVFPLGELTKPRVREIAAELGLPNAERPESFEICFIPDNDYARYLMETHAGELKNLEGGKIVRHGNVVGTHPGYPYYTIGQRKGIGAYGTKTYVIGISAATNTVYIGGNDELMSTTLHAHSANWIGLTEPAQGQTVSAKIRYKDEATEAKVFSESSNRFRIEFRYPKRAITPGQSVVLYNGDEVLGGGIIE